ncbi:DUF1643 domain-containing protein [Plantibacter sp. CFBP 8775]|uniref:DUF1643 domain-containing protein n=1 Tax=Plantibacter sp. CFBP 8775 TaxID=2774038 RepID=UPI001783898F|nr:DUF1643 domain-containing protein [Plantibacter sp. CFBP 8775]MBD8103986.1 DUF1643 domain-containing protein [Plantibacter sp. CFBP 8775]
MRRLEHVRRNKRISATPGAGEPVTATMLYERTADNSARFLLGTSGMNPLVCVGVNPSTATPDKLDHTVTRVSRYAELNGHDSWTMLNIYPQRSTSPEGMHLTHLPHLQSANEQCIATFIGSRQLTLVAAWGELVTTRPYLPRLLERIVEIADRSSCEWQSIGELLKSHHPRHPSRGPYLDLQPFDVGSYVRRLPKSQ